MITYATYAMREIDAFLTVANDSNSRHPRIDLCCICLDPLGSRWYGCMICCTLNHVACRFLDTNACFCELGDL